MRHLDPRELLERRRDAARRAARGEDALGHLSGLAHYVFGLVGIAGGAIAAATAGDSSVLAGVLAAVGSGGVTFFSFERRSAALWARAAAFQRVADIAENRLACSGQDTYEALNEVQDLLDRARHLAAGVPLDEPPQPAGGQHDPAST